MNRKGLTLIELIVVMAIVAIGAVLVAPNIGAWIPTYRLKSATRDVVSAMRVAQIKSVSSNVWYRVNFGPGNGKYSLESSQDLGITWTKEGDDLILPSGVNIRLTTFAGNTAVFYPDSSTNGGSLTLINTKGYQKVISLLGTTGRIKHG
jgi:prepilin-type N-terminal cleavage/methylation domain-containing protein